MTNEEIEKYLNRLVKIKMFNDEYIRGILHKVINEKNDYYTLNDENNEYIVEVDNIKRFELLKMTEKEGYQAVIERLKNQYEWYPKQYDRWVKKEVVMLVIPILEQAIKNDYSIDRVLYECDKLNCYRDSNSWDFTPRGLNSVKSMLHSLRNYID